jgi:hypothetical protein
MELQTRPLTFDEMYFKKPIIVHLTTPPLIAAEANGITAPISKPGNKPSPQVAPAPSIDLSNEVFPAPPITNESPVFFNKYWPWILAGVVVVAAAGVVIYKKQQEKKAANSSGN